MNVGTVGVLTLGDGVTVVGDGLVIVGDVLSLAGDALDVDDDGLGVDGLLPIDPVVPVTPVRPVDDSEVLVVDDVGGDDPIELVGAGVVGETLGVIGDGNPTDQVA